MWREGSREAEDELFARVLPELRTLARRFVRTGKAGHSVQSVELVNEIYFKLVSAKDRDWQSRRHFFAYTAVAMRHYLIDRARARAKGELVPASEFIAEFN